MQHAQIDFPPFLMAVQTQKGAPEMNLDMSLGAGLDKPSFFEVAAHERVVLSLHGAFEHAITVSVHLMHTVQCPYKHTHSDIHAQTRLVACVPADAS